MSALTETLPARTLERCYVAWAKGSTRPEVIADVLKADGYEFEPVEINEGLREIERAYKRGEPLPF